MRVSRRFGSVPVFTCGKIQNGRALRDSPFLATAKTRPLVTSLSMWYTGQTKVSGVLHEKDISAEQGQAQPEIWFSGENGNPGWKDCVEEKAREGAEKAQYIERAQALLSDGSGAARFSPDGAAKEAVGYSDRHEKRTVCNRKRC
jgi:hypothetical protein